MVISRMLDTYKSYILEDIVKNKIIAVIVVILVFSNMELVVAEQKKNLFFTWDDFVENFGDQMDSSEQLFLNMTKGGLNNNSILSFDFHFVSNNQKNIIALEAFLKNIIYIVLNRFLNEMTNCGNYRA